jgi:hypothetical protein
MPELLLIDIALCAVLIMLAALIVMRHRRRSRAQPSVDAEERPGAATEPAGEEMASYETAVLPGFSADTAQPGPGADMPAGPEQAPLPVADVPAGPKQAPLPVADVPAGPKQAPLPVADVPAGPKQAPQPVAEVPAALERTVEPQVSVVTGPEPGANGQSPSPNGQGPSSNGQPTPADAVTGSDPIGSYYDEADRPMSDYLATLGWAEEPAPRDLRRSNG